MSISFYMHIISEDGEFIKKDIFQDICLSWFNDLQCNYLDMPTDRQLDPVPAEVVEDIKTLKCYGFRRIKVKDYLDWYVTMKPNVDIGWVTKEEAWNYYNRGIIPELTRDINCLLAETVIEDCEFIKIVYENSKYTWLYDYLFAIEDISGSDYIIYYFGY